MQKPAYGLTLFSLLVTLLLISTLAGLALPAFGEIVARSRIHAEVNALFHAVHLARKESILRRHAVSLCPTAGETQCSPTTDWSEGWILFGNDNDDSPPRLDPGEPVLMRHAVDKHTRIAANRPGFTLRATVKRATNGTFVVCDSAARVPPVFLIVSFTGRPRVAPLTGAHEASGCAD